MVYHPRSAEEDKKIGELWITGHTDNGKKNIRRCKLLMLLTISEKNTGSLTLLFSQNIAAYALCILIPSALS